jgi:hypothetical protein
MPSTNTTVSNETISVLDEQYRYISSAEVVNAKWLDLSNVMSVKRDKTIYAIRARNTYNFTGNDNTQFFANTISEYQLQTTPGGDYSSGTIFTSNIYRGFGTAKDNGVANNIFEVLVYGNAVTEDLKDMGVGGSLVKDFKYDSSKSINVQSNVTIYGNRSDSDLSSYLPTAYARNISGNVLSISAADGTTANVNGNATCFQKVQYNDSTVNPWNRLINATVNSKPYVNASTDPCDFNGNAVNNQITNLPGTEYTNEAFRHQFQLRKNTNSTSQNPIYVARISRFGQRLSDDKGNVISSNLAIQHFSSNFFASIPSDNSLYAGGNLISAISITGNIVGESELRVFNSNFTSGKLYPAGGVSGNFNGNVTNRLSSLDNNSRYLTINKDPNQTGIDSIKKNAGLIDDEYNITSTGTFSSGDRFGFVQANVALDQGYMLMDRIAFTGNTNFVKASSVFSNVSDTSSQLVGDTIQNYGSLWFSSNMWASPSLRETSSKYLVIKGIDIQENNWTTTSLMTPSSLAMPTILGNPNLTYTPIGNTVNTYLRRGSISMKNYTYVNDKTLSGVKYISTVPGFINGVILPSENITLSSNVLENGNNLIGSATKQLKLPLLGNATAQINANISCNYTILFSGNVNVENRVNKSANVVCPVNFANSFIANCWNYDEVGAPVNGPGAAKILSNVSIIYGENKPLINGEVVKALRLDSPFANVNITYDLEFVNVTGLSNAETVLTRDNYVFYANLNSDGSSPSTNDTSILTSSSISQLNNNQHINAMNLQGKAYSEYDFDTLSYKFTDGSGVLGGLEKGENYNYNYILPSALVQSSGNVAPNSNVLINNNDSHLNVIVDYLAFNSLPNDGYKWHELTLYNVAYRYGIESVSVVNGSTFNNDLLLNNQSFNPSNLYANASVNPQVNGNIEASAISCYVYENLSTDSSRLQAQSELLYPFTVPKPDGSIPGTPGSPNSVNALFPGFRYAGSGVGPYSVFAAKSTTECDLILPANSGSVQLAQIIIQSQDLENGTFKVGLSNGLAKPIAIKPVPHGRSQDGTPKYATPIVCGISGEPNSYVIVMVECASSLPTDGLTGDISRNTPVYINVSIIETDNNGKQQLTMNASLRVFNDNNIMSQIIADDFNIKTSICQTCYVSSSAGSFNQTAQLGVNIYSVPANGSIISFIYDQAVVKRVLSYKRDDYAIIPTTLDQYQKVSTTTPHFAFSLENPSSTAQADGIFPAISAYSTRYYLDTRTSGIFIDVANDTNLTAENMPNLRVGRSVEWVLKRSYGSVTETVGRGLMSKSLFNPVSSQQTYYVYENLTQNASGYLHCITTNVVDLASRCIMQKLQTNAFIRNDSNNKNNWIITTLSDQLNAMIVRIDGESGQLFESNANANIIKQRSVRLNSNNQTVDLGLLFGSENYAEKFVSLVIGPIRGFGFNPQAANGTLINMNASMFALTIQPDNYCLVNLQPGTYGGTQGSSLSGSDVLFSQENVVKTKYENDFSLSFNNASLAYQYLDSSPNPLSVSAFTLIGSYLYKGFGEVEIYTKDFTSNYNTDLNPAQSVTAQTLDPLGNPLFGAWQVDNLAPGEVYSQKVAVRFDSVTSKYYFNLDENVNGGNPSDRVYFRGLNTLPTLLNNQKSLLLYTGLRPLVLNVLQVGPNGGTLEACITAASKFNWNNSNINNANNTNNIFTNLSTSLVASSLDTNVLSNQFYQVVLTNENAALSSFNYRSVLYTLSPAWFHDYNQSTNPNRNFFGTYEVDGDMFQDLRLNISRTGTGSVSTRYDLVSSYKGFSQNSQASESVILEGQYGDITYANNNFKTFSITGASSNQQSLDYLFDISVLGGIGQYLSGDGQGFTLNILPAQMSIYTAIDANNNGEIDNQKSNNVDPVSQFGLQNMFSEMNIVLPPANAATTSYRLPTVISSWELTRDFNSAPIPGCPFDIKLNNRWSVGYNLDCYFTIAVATSAQFDVITVSTKASTNNPSLTNLEVRTTAPLMIKNKNDWARSLISENAQANNYGSLSGLTFKLNSSKNVIAGEIVRIFVDNTIADNTNEWTVNSTGSSPRTYRLYAYDQERYAALLDEQLSINNTFA